MLWKIIIYSWWYACIWCYTAASPLVIKIEVSLLINPAKNPETKKKKGKTFYNSGIKMSYSYILLVLPDVLYYTDVNSICIIISIFINLTFIQNTLILHINIQNGQNVKWIWIFYFTTARLVQSKRTNKWMNELFLLPKWHVLSENKLPVFKMLNL